MAFGFGFGSRGGCAQDALLFASLMKRSVAWYDAYFNEAVLFQEAAASTPADAPSDPIGAWRDVFARDVAATTDTAGGRPLLGRTIKGGRTNLLTYTEDFTNAAYTKINVTPSDDATLTPDGYVAQKIEATATAVTQLRYLATGLAKQEMCLSFVAMQGSGADGGSGGRFGIRNATTSIDHFFISLNFTTGVISYPGSVITSGATAENLGAGKWRVTMPISSGFSDGDNVLLYIGWVGTTPTAGTYSYVGELMFNEGVAPLPYQRVGSTLDVSRIGVQPILYAAFDQVDDALTVTLPDLGDDATVAYANATEVVILEDQTISGTHVLVSPTKLSALIIWDGPLTGAEKATIRRVLTPRVEAV